QGRPARSVRPLSPRGNLGTSGGSGRGGEGGRLDRPTARFLRSRRLGAGNPRAARRIHRHDAPQRTPVQRTDALRRSRSRGLERSVMKISRVDLFVLKSPGLYNNPDAAEEPLGPTYMGVVKVTTDS